MSEQPDSDHVTYVSPADYDRINASLDAPIEPNPRMEAAAEQMHQGREATPERDGYTIGVYLPPEATEADREAIMTRVADAVHDYQYQGQWDPHVVGHAGDLLYVEHHPDDVTDFAAHVRERWVD